MANVLIARGQFGTALPLLLSAGSGLDELLEVDPGHARLIRDFVKHQVTRARAAFAVGEFSEARSHARRGRQIVEEQLASKPDSLRLLQLYADASHVLAESLRHLQATDESKAIATAAMARIDDRVGQDLELMLSAAGLRLLAGMSADEILEQLHQASCRVALYWPDTLIEAEYRRVAGLG